MRNAVKRICALILTLALVLCSIPISAIAESLSIEGSKEASPTELTPGSRQTEVTLSLPSAEYRNVYDIVFVMDSSTSTVNSNIDFAIYVDELLSEVVEHDATIRVSVIKFRGLAFDTIDLASDGKYSGLVEYSDATADAILSGVNYPEANLKALSSGTNMHGGLEMAYDLLADDTEVPDSHKFVITLTDGKSYIWNSGDGTPMSYYSQWYQHYAIMGDGVPALSQKYGYDMDSYYVGIAREDVIWYNDYQDIYDSTNADFTGESKYEQRCAYAYKEGVPAGTVARHDTINGAELFPRYRDYQYYYEFQPNDSWQGMVWLEANPYEVVVNDDGTYSFNPDAPNPDFYMRHPSSLEKGLYMAGHLWTDMDASYNTAAITYAGKSTGSGLNCAESFCKWIQENSDYGADITNASDVAAVFDSISDEIIYMVAQGTVTDVIPDEFTLVENDTDTFTLAVGGEKLAATADGDAAWNFGTPNDSGVYPYRVEYNADENSFTWIINVPIEVSNPVTLSYTLEIDEDAEEGEHDTNVSAILDYVTSSGVEGVYKFEIPVVTYKRVVTYTASKVWDDSSDADGIRPDSVMVQLYADGEAIGDAVTLDASNDWTYTWEGLSETKDGETIDYEVQEVSVPDGYTSEVAEDDSGYEATVTNTHTPSQPPAPPKPKEPESTTPAQNVPKTGDPSSPMALAIVGLAGAAAISLSLLIKRREGQR